MEQSHPVKKGERPDLCSEKMKTRPEKGAKMRSIGTKFCSSLTVQGLQVQLSDKEPL